MLDPFSRGAIVAMSTLCVAGAVALAPVRVRGSSDPGNLHPTLAARETFAAASIPDIDVRRDPFAGESVAGATPTMAAAPALMAGTAAPALPRGEIGPLPSNIAASTIPAIPGDATNATATPRVTAIVTGAHPYAMLDTAGNHEIKGIGDRVHDTPIVSIDINGVTLQGGQRLTVTPGELSQ